MGGGASKYRAESQPSGIPRKSTVLSRATQSIGSDASTRATQNIGSGASANRLKSQPEEKSSEIPRNGQGVVARARRRLNVAKKELERVKGEDETLLAGNESAEERAARFAAELEELSAQLEAEEGILEKLADDAASESVLASLDASSGEAEDALIAHLDQLRDHVEQLREAASSTKRARAISESVMELRWKMSGCMEGCEFSFVSADALRNWNDGALPRHQDIHTTLGTPFVSRHVTLKDVLYGSKHMAKILVVSHRWVDPDYPDADGMQLESVRKYLMEHPDIELVWFDFWSLPQRPRSNEEDVVFHKTLDNIFLLFLGAQVLILLDLQYIGRFWTSYETWLSLKSVSSDGLVPSSQRVTIKCLGAAHATEQLLTDTLITQWKDMSVEMAYDKLKHEDILVTNQKDKDDQLNVLSQLGKRVPLLYKRFLPLAKEEPTSANATRFLYAVGGLDTKTVERFDPETEKWTAMPDMPSARRFFAAAACRGRIYVVGGENVNTVDVFDPESSSWSSGPSPAGSDYRGFSAAAVGARLIAIGGRGQRTSTEVLDLDAGGGWQKGPALLAGMWGGAATASGDFVYALGGLEGDGKAAQRLQLASRRAAWERLPSMTCRRSNLAAAALGELVFAIGGVDGSTHLSSVEVLRPGARQWELVARMAQARSGRPGAAVCAGRLFVLGGADGDTANDRLDTVEELDGPKASSWVSRPSMATKRAQFAAVAL